MLIFSSWTVLQSYLTFSIIYTYEHTVERLHLVISYTANLLKIYMNRLDHHEADSRSIRRNDNELSTSINANNSAATDQGSIMMSRRTTADTDLSGASAGGSGFKGRYWADWTWGIKGKCEEALYDSHITLLAVQACKTPALTVETSLSALAKYRTCRKRNGG